MVKGLGTAPGAWGARRLGVEAVRGLRKGEAAITAPNRLPKALFLQLCACLLGMQLLRNRAKRESHKFHSAQNDNIAGCIRYQHLSYKTFIITKRLLLQKVFYKMSTDKYMSYTEEYTVNHH